MNIYYQRSLLPDAPPVDKADVIRLSALIRRLAYGDALLCGSWRLDRQVMQQIKDIDNDNASDGTLVTGSLAEYLVYLAGTLYGVVEVRSKEDWHLRNIHNQLALYLLERGWTLAATCLLPCGAVTHPGMNLERTRRLLKDLPLTDNWHTR